MTNELQNYSEEELKLAKQLSGENSGVNATYIPKIKINNKKEEQMANINGVETKVEVPAKKGFLITQKGENNDYVVSFFREALSAGFLKQRYSVSSKYQTLPQFFSREFDNFSEVIDLLDPENKKVINSGPYKQLKQSYLSGEQDSLGNDKSNLSLKIILHLDVDGDILKMELKGAAVGRWLTYKNTFGKNETISGIKTDFNLGEEISGTNKYWALTPTKGEALNLTEQLKKQMAITKYIQDLKSAYEGSSQVSQEVIDSYNTGDDDFFNGNPPVTEIEEGPKEGEENKEDIIVESIPF